jgi:AcrR family transcriptional regulator
VDGRGEVAATGEVLGEALRQLVVEKLQEKAVQKAQAGTAKAHLQTQALEHLAERIASLELWTRAPAGVRATKLDREAIADAALRLVDAEGLDALSMRRLAADLGVGTMTLYSYVRTKDELLALVVDAVMAEVVVPGPLPEGWRDALAAIARRSHAAFQRHPWMFGLHDDDLPLGPHSIRHFDQTLQAVAGLPLPRQERFEVAALVDEYVVGFAHRAAEDGPHGPSDEMPPDVGDYLAALVATGAYPAIGVLAAELGLAGAWAEVARAYRPSDDRFERGLQRVLDGVAASLRG